MLFEFDDTAEQLATHGFTGVELARATDPTARRAPTHIHSYNPSNPLSTGLHPLSRERESNLSRSPSQWSTLTGDDDEEEEEFNNSNLESDSRVPSDTRVNNDDDDDVNAGDDGGDGDFAITRTMYLPLGSLAHSTTMAGDVSAPLPEGVESLNNVNYDNDQDPSASVFETREQEARERLALASAQRATMTTSPSVSRLRWSPFLEQLR